MPPQQCPSYYSVDIGQFEVKPQLSNARHLLVATLAVFAMLCLSGGAQSFYSSPTLASTVKPALKVANIMLVPQRSATGLFATGLDAQQDSIIPPSFPFPGTSFPQKATPPVTASAKGWQENLGLVTGIAAMLCSLLALHCHRQTISMATQVGRKVPPRPEDVEFDGEAVVRYIAATALQWGLILGTLGLLDKGMAALEATSWVPPNADSVLIVLFFLFTAVRSRVFSPLDNSRPTVQKEKDAIDEMRRPSWMPPPLVFPVVWSTIAILRTIAGYLIWADAGKTLLVPPLMLYFLALSIGDTWNTIQNVEKRPGMAVIGVSFVWVSAIATNYYYYNTLPLAGQVIAPQSLWLSIAAVLIFDIWRINGKEPLYPFKLRQ